MKGHIRQRGKKSWEITYEAAPRNAAGVRHQKTCTVRGTKRDAQRKLREILNALDTCPFDLFQPYPRPGCTRPPTFGAILRNGID